MNHLLAQLVDPSPLPQPQANQETFNTILSIFFAIVGAVAVLVIIVAGIRYILSQGDPNKIADAKRQLLYAVIGLIIAALALVIVNFVLERV